LAVVDFKVGTFDVLEKRLAVYTGEITWVGFFAVFS
jgi:hypothetical protein